MAVVTHQCRRASGIGQEVGNQKSPKPHGRVTSDTNVRGPRRPLTELPCGKDDGPGGVKVRGDSQTLCDPPGVEAGVRLGVGVEETHATLVRDSWKELSSEPWLHVPSAGRSYLHGRVGCRGKGQTGVHRPVGDGRREGARRVRSFARPSVARVDPRQRREEARDGLDDGGQRRPVGLAHGRAHLAGSGGAVPVDVEAEVDGRRTRPRAGLDARVERDGDRAAAGPPAPEPTGRAVRVPLCVLGVAPAREDGDDLRGGARVGDAHQAGQGRVRAVNTRSVGERGPEDAVEDAVGVANARPEVREGVSEGVLDAPGRPGTGSGSEPGTHATARPVGVTVAQPRAQVAGQRVLAPPPPGSRDGAAKGRYVGARDRTGQDRPGFPSAVVGLPTTPDFRESPARPYSVSTSVTTPWHPSRNGQLFCVFGKVCVTVATKRKE